MEVKAFFDRYWSNARLRRFDTYYDFLQIVNKDLFNKIADVPHERILVVGLGKTADTGRFKEIKAELTATDISLGGLESLSCFSRVQMDAHAAGLKSGMFDIVFLRTVMLHCDHMKLFGELARVLSAEGHLFWVEPLKHNPFLWIYRCLFSPGRFTRMNYLAYDELEELRNMFAKVWHRECYLLSVLLLPVFVIFPPLRGLVVFLQRLEMQLIAFLPWLRRWCWISYGYAGVRKCS